MYASPVVIPSHQHEELFDSVHILFSPFLSLRGFNLPPRPLNFQSRPTTTLILPFYSPLLCILLVPYNAPPPKTPLSDLFLFINFANFPAHSPQQSCDLHCPYFSSVFISTTTTASTHLLCRIVRIPRRSPFLNEFLTSNLDTKFGPASYRLPNV